MLDLDIHWEKANPYPGPIQVRVPSEKSVGIFWSPLGRPNLGFPPGIGRES